jgi:hypothetical protein
MAARCLKLGVLLGALLFAIARCAGQGSPNEPKPVCSITIVPSAQSFGEDGGPGAVTVTAPAACAWIVTSSAGWITIISGASGTGPGTVAYSVPAYGETNSRSGTLTIGGQTHTVSQQGRAPTTCTYHVSPSGADFGKDAADGTFAVTAPADCGWTATSSAPWLVVGTGNQGSGNGTVSYSIARNRDVSDRAATVTVADQVFTVRQAGDTPAIDCQYSVTPVSATPCMPGGSLVATVTTQASCTWTASANVSWIGIPSGASGAGSGVITITFPDNYDAPREGVVMVRWPTPTAGQNIHVAQAGCRYAVSRSAISAAAAGGPGTFDVIQESDPNTCGGATQDRCIWTAASDVPWITVTSSMPRAGDNPVSFTVAANNDVASRVGRINVRDQVVVITQAGR